MVKRGCVGGVGTHREEEEEGDLSSLSLPREDRGGRRHPYTRKTALATTLIPLEP